MTSLSFQDYALLQLDYHIQAGSLLEPTVISVARTIINNIIPNAVYCSISPAWEDELVLMWKAGGESVTIYIEVNAENNPEETIVTIHRENEKVSLIETPFSDINDTYFKNLNTIISTFTARVNKLNPTWKKIYKDMQ